ncbi:MAG: YcxB family protein [Tenericutes bacterium]|nr:YcxB family protein [Mycoplasmatota bacterium]
MEIHNKTLYDKDLIMAYNNFYLTSYIKKNFLIISGISAVFIIYMMVIQEWLYALLLFGILLFYLLLTFFMQKLTTKRILKRSPLVKEPVMQTYVFRDNEFEVANVNSMVVPYSNISKFKEGKKFYLLQSKDRKTYIVDYNGFATQHDKEKFDIFAKETFTKKRR